MAEMSHLDAALHWLNRDHGGDVRRAIAHQRAREYRPEPLQDCGEWIAAGCDQNEVCMSSIGGATIMTTWENLLGVAT